MASLVFHVSSFSSFWKLLVTVGYALGVMSGACACMDQILFSGLLSVSLTKFVNKCSVKCNHVFDNHVLYWGKEGGRGYHASGSTSGTA